MPPPRVPRLPMLAGFVAGTVGSGTPAEAAAPFPRAPIPHEAMLRATEGSRALDPVPSGRPETEGGSRSSEPATAPGLPGARLPELYRELHPVRDPFLARWQHATAREMSGAGASPWYRDLSVALDVTWRLSELSAQPVVLDTAVRDRALDMAIAGATSGWNTTMYRSMQRRPELAPLQTMIRSAISPSLRIERGHSGGTRVRTDDGTARNQQAAMADINQGPTTGPSPSPRSGPQPSLRTGSAFTLVSVPTSADVRAGSDADSPLSPGMTSWIDVREVGVDAARLQARMSQNPERARFRPQVRWAAMARQGLLPDWAAIADLQGRSNEVGVVRSAVALEHQLARYGLPGWALRAAASRELRDDLEPTLYEERVMVSVRTNLGWYVPQDIDRWPLGHRPGAPGPVLPQLRPGGPTEPVPLASTPAERSGGPTSQALVADR